MDISKICLAAKHRVGFLFLRRSVAAILCFLCLCTTTMQRVNLSFAVVDMVNSTIIDRGHSEDNSTSMDCPTQIYNSSNISSSTGEFFWNPDLQGYILSSTFIGGVIGQIPGGILAAKYGSKKLLVSTLLLASSCNLFSPWIARMDPYFFISLHFIKGVAQGAMIVSTSLLITNWFPKSERGFAGAFVNTGLSVGAFIGCVGSGSLCALDFWEGWPLVFYTFGLLGVFVSTLLLPFYNNLPEEDPWITDTELKHIQDSQDRTSFKTRPPTPWVTIMRSKSVYPMILALIGQRWMIFYFMSANPIYFGTVLNLSIKRNGVLSAGLYTCQAVAGWLTSYLSLWMSRHCKLEINRKFFNSFATMVFSLGLIGMSIAKCDIAWNVIGLYIAATSVGFSYAGVFITAVDISPTFCGPVFGLTHSIGNISGFLVPVMVGELTNGAQNLIQWEKILLISAGITFGCNLIWVFLGSTAVEPWDPMSKPRDSERQTRFATEQKQCLQSKAAVKEI